MHRLALLALAFAALGCGPPPNALEGKLSKLQPAVFQNGGCTGCHYDDTANGKLNLMAGKSFAALVDQASRVTTWQGTQWEGKRLVVPGDPDNSLLVVVLEQPAGIPETLKMPATGGVKVPADRIAAVRQWIEDGAKND